MNETDKQFANHLKKIPCFTCIVRVFCLHIEGGKLYPREYCDELIKWIEEKLLITNHYTDAEYEKKTKFPESIVLEILKQEKEKRKWMK